MGSLIELNDTLLALNLTILPEKAASILEARVGIFSGTFDPIHQGHVAFALAAKKACQLERVVFLPEPKPRNKRDVTDLRHRVALIERATKANASLRVLSLDSDQFTVKDTLPQLQAAFKGAQLTFLVGSDVVRTFRYRWEGLSALFNQVSFAVGMRAGDNPHEIAAIMTEMEQEYNVKPRYALICTPDSGLASSQIRGGSASKPWLLSPEMLSYIQDHDLYPLARPTNIACTM